MSAALPQEAFLLATGRPSTAWQRFLSLLNSQIDDVVNYTPLVLASAGTITSALASARYQRIGKQVVLNGEVQVTNNGTGSGELWVTLPDAKPAPVQTIGTGSQDTGTSFKSMQVMTGAFILQSRLFFSVAITNTDGTYPTAGTTIYFSMVYEVA